MIVVKKCLYMFLSLLCVISMAGCQPKTDSPAVVTQKFLAAIRKQKLMTAGSYYDGDLKDLSKKIDLGSLKLSKKKKLTKKEKALAVKLVDRMTDYTYKVSDQQINKDHATVKVTLKTYHFGNALKDITEKVVKQSFKSLLNRKKVSSASVSRQIISLADEKLDTMKRNYTVSTKLSLKKVNNHWKISGISKQALNAFSGDLLNEAEMIKDNLTAYGKK